MEVPVTFECEGEQLVGIFSEGKADTAVLLVVGGPQYRAGSHRQFTLLCRYLAEAGIPSLRFDYRGMGDSSGVIHDFEDVQQDIKAAVDQLFVCSPGLKQVVLWGLCDAASANLFYAYTDPRIKGVVLLNPWVRTVEGEAKAYLKHYYLSRLTDKEMWQKILSGKFDFKGSFASLGSMVLKLLNPKSGSNNANSANSSIAQHSQLSGSLPERMLQGLKNFNGRVLLILSGDDLTADEFRDLVASSTDWKQTIANKNTTQHTLQEANHTFSSKAWRRQVEQWTADWVLTLNNEYKKN